MLDINIVYDILLRKTFNFSIDSLITALREQTEADVDRFSCSEVINYT
jgi:hypothetical protein